MSSSDAVMLLVGKPGHLRDALESLVNAMPGLGKLITADTGLLALVLARETHPPLILVGGGLPDAEVLEFVKQVKIEHPGASCLVLTEQAQQRQLALAAGADHVLPNGVPFGQMLVVIQQMLTDAATKKVSKTIERSDPITPTHSGSTLKKE